MPVGEVLDELPPALVDLALWVADYYGSTPARALALVAPPKRKRRKEQAPPAERQALAGEAEPERLSEPQRAAVARIVEAMDGGGGHMLLWGATGSGKTEVYLQACAAALERGLGAIVLVPEIALAPQTVGRVRARFGDRVAILHSALTEAERRDERERIASGEAPIVVGARSAIFAPLPRVGLICVDEEHDASYKQESDPRYDARTVAAKRAALEGAVAVYGSATPRPESWASLERLVLGGRIAGPLPPVRVVDLRREAGYPLSAPLLEELGAVAKRGGKAILLLNRRGLAPALHCRACGATRRCPNCDVALVLHGDDGLRCHHCGHREPTPETCPECGSAELARLGAGTQRLERELAQALPGARARPPRRRHDRAAGGARRRARAASPRPTARSCSARRWSRRATTSPNVALAAVVDADTGLALPDFRAEERTFQLLTQLAGRSGRDAPGPRARPDLPAGRAADRARREPRRRALPRPASSSGARRSATRRSATSSGSSRAGPEAAAPLKALEELRDAMRGRRAARPGAAAAPARPPPRAARREDRRAARRSRRRRRACSRRPRPRCAAPG